MQQISQLENNKIQNCLKKNNKKKPKTRHSPTKIGGEN